MNKKLLVLIVAALCISATPAMANVIFDLEDTKMTVNTLHADVAFDLSAVSSPGLTAKIKEGGTVLQQTDLTGTADNFDMNIDFTSLGGGAYYGIGDFFIKDDSGVIKAEGTFDTRDAGDVELNAQGKLEISGRVGASVGNSTVLVPNSNPWTFEGDIIDISLASGVEKHTHGFAYVVQFDLGDHGISTLDELFSSTGLVLTAGDVDITVVPVPAAVVLGALGLGAAGLKLRKRERKEA
jgi:hypothetical protein